MDGLNFCGTIKMTKGMTCYNKNLSDDTLRELSEIGLDKARGSQDKLEGTPVLDTNNIDAINSYGLEYYLPKSNEKVFLRFNSLKLNQADMDSFLLAYNSVKDNDVQIDVNA